MASTLPRPERRRSRGDLPALLCTAQPTPAGLPLFRRYRQTCHPYTHREHAHAHQHRHRRHPPCPSHAKSGALTKKAVVETALRLLVQTHSQTSIRRLRGNIQWRGDSQPVQISPASRNRPPDLSAFTESRALAASRMEWPDDEHITLGKDVHPERNSL